MNNTGIKMTVIPGESSSLDKGALICDGIMLVICLWNQIRYGMEMWFLIIPLAFIGVFLYMFGVVPETYHFTKNTLVITQRFRKEKKIPYEAVFNYESSSRDAFINISQSNSVKIYYTVGKKKKVEFCKPCNVETFVDALKMNCNEFHGEEKKSQLDIFFNNN